MTIKHTKEVLMKALIVYDSYFGNTEKVAQAMADALGLQESSTVIKVSDLKPEQLKGIELLIVGSPTRAFRPSDGIKAFLKGLPVDSLKGVRVAAFDTRIKPSDIKQAVLRFFVNAMGYAAKPIANGLVKKGGNLTASPDGFYVKESKGPLYKGELERAVAWVKRINPA
jgi:flavodoxin